MLVFHMRTCRLADTVACVTMVVAAAWLGQGEAADRDHAWRWERAGELSPYLTNLLLVTCQRLVGEAGRRALPAGTAAEALAPAAVAVGGLPADPDPPWQWGQPSAGAGGAEHHRGTLVPVPIGAAGAGPGRPRGFVPGAARELRGRLRGLRHGPRPGEPPRCAGASGSLRAPATHTEQRRGASGREPVRQGWTRWPLEGSVTAPACTGVCPSVRLSVRTPSRLLPGIPEGSAHKCHECECSAPAGSAARTRGASPEGCEGWTLAGLPARLPSTSLGK